MSTPRLLPNNGLKTILAALVVHAITCNASLIFVDSFLEEGSTISESGGTRTDELEEESLFDSRWVALRDRRRQAEVEATIGQGRLQIQMNSSLESFLSLVLPSVFLRYYSQTSVALRGSTALAIDVEEIVGRGYIYVEIDTQLTPDGERNRVEVTEPGLVLIPSSLFSLENTNSLEDFNALNITLEGRDPGFSATITELGLIPEPSVLVLTVLGGVGVWMGRKTRHPGRSQHELAETKSGKAVEQAVPAYPPASGRSA